MDKKSLLAIGLSAIILVVWMSVFQRQDEPTISAVEEVVENTEEQPVSNPGGIRAVSYDDSTKEQTTFDSTDTGLSTQDEALERKTLEETIIPISTDVYQLKFSSKNASLQSLLLNIELEDDTRQSAEEDLEIIPNGELHQAFKILWGDNNAIDESTDVIYEHTINKIEGGTEIDFYRDFINADNKKFTVHKIYTIKEGEYVIELRILITNATNQILALGNNFSYSLLYGPQIGPYAEIAENQKSRQLSRRRLVGRDSKKARFINLKNNRVEEKTQFYQWAGITGRYISMLILTGSTSYVTQFSTYSAEGLNAGAQIMLRRPRIQSSAVEDRYRIYFGPNVNKILKRYNNAEDNSFEIQNANFDDIKGSRILDFLQVPMHALLNLLYRIVKNYGIAIILLTLLVRGITIPFIKKSKETSKKMKALGPKMKSIRETHADDPMKMNQAIMELYRKEKVSPFSSVLPMLIQLPIFLSMYRVIYESFELWQAPFLGWIHDLSAPDELISFGDFQVPLLGWTSLNILPIIMISTQYVSSFIMMRQQDTSAAGGSQKLIFVMSYIFPFMIFFALYNSPSGLILYWICSNLFTILTMTDWKKKGSMEEQIIVKKKAKIKG